MNDAEKIIIIAEAGVNHNASMEMARRMVVGKPPARERIMSNSRLRCLNWSSHR